jgi:hypothetical protein
VLSFGTAGLASIAPIANNMPDHLTLEIDDATVRVFGWGHATDLADLTARLRYAIRLGDAVTGALRPRTVERLVSGGPVLG